MVGDQDVVVSAGQELRCHAERDKAQFVGISPGWQDDPRAIAFDSCRSLAADVGRGEAVGRTSSNMRLLSWPQLQVPMLDLYLWNN